MEDVLWTTGMFGMALYGVWLVGLGISIFPWYEISIDLEDFARWLRHRREIRIYRRGLRKQKAGIK